MKPIQVVVLVLALSLNAAMAQYIGDGAWLASVPAKDHERTNPYHGQADAIAAGANIFEEHCAKCHGATAEGTKKRPSLRTDRVQKQATVGDLHWLLVNGNMKKGMPSWAKLPDAQLWQVITYVKSLPE